ncbi:PREDICTED: synaptotagmin-4-like [Nanorana parkeri]|uniref:synaptotagmin-4-like n=1 Tax=Nanorana parkeri TaxID=125878 RepID=UPI000854389B|nr:PREDICTED: synaptotagmin-4-like [Nanorana parkeri]
MIEGVVVFLFIWLLIQVLLNKHQEVHLQVLLGAGLALLCFCLLLGCAICWHKSRRQQSTVNHEKDSVLQDNKCLELSDNSERSISMAIYNQYQTLHDNITPRGEDEQPVQQEQNAISDRSMHVRASLPSLYQLPRKTKHVLKRRSTVFWDGTLESDRASLVKMPHSHTEPDGFSGVKQKAQPLVHFTLYYSLSEEALTITVTGFSNLPKRLHRKKNSFVRAYLLPGFLEPHYGHTEDSDRGQKFAFFRYSPENLKERTLRLAVYSRDRNTQREGFIGEMLFPCAQVDWTFQAASEFTRELSVTKPKLKKSLSTMDMFSSSTSAFKSPGQILILLQHQSQASRIKVMVQKAESLGKRTRIPGAPDHFVSIRLIQDKQVIDVKETRTVSGSSPVWNAPFLFDVPLESMQSQSLCLEFLVMQGRIYNRARILGRVLIGAGSSEVGMAHWQEMCNKSPIECSHWHVLQLDVS